MGNHLPPQALRYHAPVLVCLLALDGLPATGLPLIISVAMANLWRRQWP